MRKTMQIFLSAAGSFTFLQLFSEKRMHTTIGYACKIPVGGRGRAAHQLK